MMTLHHLLWALLNSVWQSAGLAVAVWALLKVVARSTAAQRYATWSATLAAAMVLPFANFALAQVVSPRQIQLAAPQTANVSHVAQAPLVKAAYVLADAQTNDTIQLRHFKKLSVAAPPWHAATLAAPRPVPAWRLWLDNLLAGRYDAAILAMWLLAVNLCLARLALGYARLSKVKKSLAYRVLSSDEQDECLALTRRPVAVGYSSEIGEPCVIGFAAPAIALPLDLALRFSKTDTERIIRHECAHIARWDDYGNLCKQLALAVLCFNPIVQAIAKVLDLEREIACDDAAAFRQADRADFARCLCDIAQLRADRGWLPTAGLGKNKSQLLIRIRQLLDGGHQHSTRLGIFSRLAIGAIVVGALPFALFQVIASRPATAAAKVAITTPPVRFDMHVAKVAPEANGGPGSQPLLAHLTVHVKTPPSSRVLTIHTSATTVHTSAMTVTSPPMVVTVPAMHIQAGMPRVLQLEITRRLPLELRQIHQMVVSVAHQEHANTTGRDAFLDALHDAGFRNLSVDDVIAICNAGVTPQFLSELHARGLTPMPAHDLVTLANAGVDPAYLEGLRSDGYGNTSIPDIIALRNAGVQPSYIAALANLGYRGLSVRDLIRLSESGVTPAFLARLQQSGVIGNRRLSVDDLIRLSDAGI